MMSSTTPIFVDLYRFSFRKGSRCFFFQIKSRSLHKDPLENLSLRTILHFWGTTIQRTCECCELPSNFLHDVQRPWKGWKGWAIFCYGPFLGKILVHICNKKHRRNIKKLELGITMDHLCLISWQTTPTKPSLGSLLNTKITKSLAKHACFNMVQLN